MGMVWYPRRSKQTNEEVKHEKLDKSKDIQEEGEDIVEETKKIDDHEGNKIDFNSDRKIINSPKSEKGKLDKFGITSDKFGAT